jgi:hypothetical protein
MIDPTAEDVPLPEAKPVIAPESKSKPKLRRKR